MKKENKNSYEKCDATIITEENERLIVRNRTTLESHESRTSEGQQLVRELRSEIMEVTASAVPSNLTRGLEENIESQKTRFKVFKEICNQK